MVGQWLDISHIALFFFNDTATTEIYTLSLHDALPISLRLEGRAAGGARAPHAAPLGHRRAGGGHRRPQGHRGPGRHRARADRKSTRLNSSHANISYAVFCLKKKKNPSATYH